MKVRTLAMLMALSCWTSACEAVLLGAAISDDEGETGSGDDGGVYDATEGNAGIENASFSGTIGQVAEISTDASASAYDDGEYASITLTASRDDWAAMVGLDLSGEDRDAFFTPGTVILLSADSFASSYACSGDATDPYAYEATQTNGRISISEAESGDMLRVDFDISYGTADAVTGSFEIEAR